MTKEILRCFEILEIEVGAQQEEIKRAYRDLVKVWHPDRFHGSPDLQRRAQEKLKLINSAYELLKDIDPQPTAGKRTDEQHEGATSNFSQNESTTGESQNLFDLASKYYSGNGALKDYFEAERLFRKAAELGSPRAQFALGQMYYRGEALRRDKDEAANWWRRAATKCDAEALYYLGVLSTEGFGSGPFKKGLVAIGWNRVNSVEAYKWFNLSVTHGFIAGKAGMEQASGWMLQSQVNEARRLATPLYPKYPHRAASAILVEWLEYYLMEIHTNRQHRKFYDRIIIDLKRFAGLEKDVVHEALACCEDEFHGRPKGKTAAWLRDVGSSWKFGVLKNADRTDSARVIARAILYDAWDSHTSNYIVRKENSINELWLRIVADKEHR